MSSPYHFDKREAEKVVNFFQKFLTHVKGHVGPLVLEPFQKKILQDLFGWKVKDTGLRKYKRSLIFMPRKNAKTTLGAGIALYCELCDNEPGAEIYSVAADREQARLCHDIAKSMVNNNHRLSSKLEIYRDSITLKGTNSFYKVTSAEADKKHGFNAHCVIFDELHAQPNRDLWDVFTTSTGTRKQPLIVAITTAGFDRTSICYEQYDYACKVRDGIIDDPEFYPAIFEAHPDDDPFEDSTHKKANPGYETIVSSSYLKGEAVRAKNTPSYLNTFKRLHLNIWTSSDQAWISPHVWALGNKGIINIDDYKGEEAYMGLDMASREDIISLSIIITKHNIVKNYYWIPKDKVDERKNKNEIDYSAWINQGYITQVMGNAHDYPAIEAKIIDLCMHFHVRKIGYDPWGMNEMAQRLLLSGAPMIPVEQTTRRLNEGTCKIEEMAQGGLISHGGDPVLAWMVDNVMILEDQEGRKKPNKRKSKDKIDGAVAMVIAASISISQSSEQADEPGIMVI